MEDTLGFQVELLVWYIEGLKTKIFCSQYKKIITALHSGFDNLIEQSLFEDNIPLLIKKMVVLSILKKSYILF